MIDQFLYGGMKNFSYLITFDGESLIVDPQVELHRWERRMQELGATLKGILLTHTHWDHVAGVPGVAAKYPQAKIYVNKLDAKRIQKYDEAVRARFVFVEDGEQIALGSQTIEVLHTPGHSAGECCFLIREEPYKLFTGDTVFVSEVGRTDLETGSTAELFHTLQRLKQLPGDTVIYPGHDYGNTPTTTIARECAESAAFRCKTIEELDALP